MRQTHAVVFGSYLALACLGAPLIAQIAPALDVSGNAQLTGPYNFRDVAYSVTDTAGNLSRSLSLTGTVQYDGVGNYTLTGTLMDSTSMTSGPQPFTAVGTYGIGSSGMGFMSSPVSAGDWIYGLVSEGIFVGSSTESLLNDLFIAAAAPSVPFTNSAFNGTYQLVAFGYPGTDATLANSASFELAADGNGGVGTNVTVLGKVAGQVAVPIQEVYTGISYAFINGAGTLSANANANTLFTGDKTLFISTDGNLVFGGSTAGWDMFIGVRTGSAPLTNSVFNGLHFQAGMDQDASQLTTGVGSLSSYYGSVNSSNGLSVGHERVNDLSNDSAYDYTYGGSYDLSSAGSYSDATQNASYVVGASGIRVGLDSGNFLGINITVPALGLTGSGVFIDPQGIVNAASFAPFTASVAPGEFITIYGSNLAALTQSATELPLSTSLGNVQVIVNGIAAPLALVSPGSISALIPYSITDAVAAIQVINNGVSSNTVTMFVALTAPGVFTFPADGLGYSAALHLDYSLVTADNPAAMGETLAIFVAGLGAVSPSVKDGIAAPGSPLSSATNALNVFIDGQPATISYAGLAPSLTGLYQLNVVVPMGTSSGDVYLDVSGPDSYTSEALLSIAPGSADSVASATTRSGVRMNRFHRGIKPSQRVSIRF